MDTGYAKCANNVMRLFDLLYLGIVTFSLAFFRA